METVTIGNIATESVIMETVIIGNIATEPVITVTVIMRTAIMGNGVVL